MNVVANRRMTVSEFLDWAAAQPKGRYELVDGQVVAMSPERARHVRTKLAVAIALRSAINRANLDCEAFADGMTVTIDRDNSREPDAAVQCSPVDPDSLVLDKPVILVEVLSPSNERADTGEKLAEYFSVPSVRHYLIVNPIKQYVIHHERSGEGRIDTRVVDSGAITLAPPGLTITLEELFEGGGR